MGEGQELHLVIFDREDKCSGYTGTEGLKSVVTVGQRLKSLAIVGQRGSNHLL